MDRSHVNRGQGCRCARRALAAGSVCTLAAGASAQTLTWNNAAGGVANLASNWSPAQLPSAASDLVFNLNSSYTVSFNNLSAASRGMTFRRGAVQLNINEPHNSGSGGLTIGDLAGDVSLMNLAFGRLNLSSVGTIGDAAGATGTLVIDEDAELNVPTPSLLRIGNGGSGTLRLLAGGSVRTADEVLVGNLVGSAGVIEVSGRSLRAPFGLSTLDVNGPALSRFGFGGRATVTIANGGIASFAGSLGVATNPASSAEVSVAGAISGNLATLEVGGSLSLARNTQSGIDGGTGLLAVAAGGTVRVGGVFEVGGDPDGGVGTLRMDAGALVETESVRLGGTGTVLDLRGGVLNVNGGTMERTPGAVPLSFGGVDTPSINLQNGATATLEPTGQIIMNIGSGTGASPGNFGVLTGSTLNTAGGHLNIGFGFGDEGLLFVQGEGSTVNALPAGIINAGVAAPGHLIVQNGGHVLADEINVGIAQNLLSTLVASGVGSVVETETLFVGGSSTGPAGQGLVRFTDGAVLEADEGFSLFRVWPAGTVQFTDATALSRSTSVLGTMELRSGTVTGTQFFVQGDGTLSAREGGSTVDAIVRALGRSVIEANGGNLVIGRPEGFDGFSAVDDTLLRVGAGARMTLRSGNGAQFIRAELRGGTLACDTGLRPAEGAKGNHTILGFGTIDGDLAEGFLLAPQLEGLRLTGSLFATVQNATLADGSRLVIGSGGQLRGVGFVEAKFELEAGGVVHADLEDALVVGDSLATDGAIINGTVISSGFLRIADSDGTTLGPVTELRFGTVASNRPLTVPQSGVLFGLGTMQAPDLRVAGTIAPARASPSELRFIRVALGDLTLLPSAVTQIDVESATAHDSIEVDGSATLGGRLVVQAARSIPGASLVIMQAVDGISGDFQALDLPPGFRLLREPNRLLLVGSCAADFNGDGAANSQDFFDFITAFFAGNADFNGDGTTNSQDFFDFLTVFFQGC